MPRVDAYIDQNMPTDVTGDENGVVFRWDGPDGDEQGGVEMHVDFENAFALALFLSKWRETYGPGERQVGSASIPGPLD